jgi:hypothetical protein
MDRRAFLGLSLSWLIFWRRGHKKLCGIEFRILRRHHSGRRYLLIHGNESTARDVLVKHMASAHGTAYLVENGARYVGFNGGELDPNRLFSDDGAEANLRMLNPNWSEAQLISARMYLDRHRDQIVDAVCPRNGDVLIALHNNGPGYSVQDETGISDRTALNDAANPHEFCLCTDRADFARLAAGAYNVVLQNRAPRVDDGSLSRLAALRGFRYVNIEAGLGHEQKQKAMLDWVDSALPG